ncbi:MAG TPA: gamma-glutamyltransferase [Hellea balneolensis]|uniref:Glutathione hydrolase proenzyme n=1 Tax=Hellea balneolensis TaxID=287478 RepID=A0A7C5LTH9_9PROT|nr:gamma-glutamyltransferase [Hellea balneolensis]
MARLFSTLLLIFMVCAAQAPGFAKDKQDASGALAFVGYDRAPFHPLVAKTAMVVAQEKMAAEVGRDILAKGGNAVDAAVATGFALAVTFPQAGNIGGGGFMLVSLANQDDVMAIDFREMAPAAAHRDMFLGADGEVDNQKAQFSHLSAGVPGTVMGLLDALDTYGTMSRAEVMAPAIRLAKNGYPISFAMAQALKAGQKQFAADPSSVAYFTKNGELYQYGDIWKQKDLAKTLKRIAHKGADGFYTGKTAELIVAEMQRGGGMITAEDLRNYKTVTRKSVHGTYRGHDIYSMPPPSSGGVHVIQMLNILEGYDLSAKGHNTADMIHVMVEAMRRAYADRSKYLGDPDYFEVPVAALIDKTYAKHLRAGISLSRASRSQDISPAKSLPYESHETTHYSVMDKWGNAVAVTYTLNFGFGSGYTVDGAGFLLNNEMDDFSAKPGSPNGYGLIGGEANKIEAGKRPLSSMTPVIVKKDGRNYFVTGSPGGSTIITSVLQNIVNVIDFNMNIMEAVTAPRFHHQWLPDVVIVEPGISEDTLKILQSRGFRFNQGNGHVARTTLGRTNAVMYDGEFLFGAADPRAPTAGAAGDK